MRLFEITSKTSVPWNWDFKSNNTAQANFTVGAAHYSFRARSSQYDHEDADTDALPDEDDEYYEPVDKDYSGYWLIEFKLMSLNGVAVPDEDSVGMAETGNAAHVISAVTDILRDFIKIYGKRIRVIEYDAHTNSKQRVYSHMFKRLLPNWPQIAGELHDVEILRP